MRWIRPARRALRVKAELLHLVRVKPAREDAIDVALGAQPRDCLGVRPRRGVRTKPRRARGAAARQVVTKHPQGMELLDHRQQLKGVSGVGLLRSSERLRLSYAALVRLRLS
jgi:hypothetical protein